MKKFFKNQKGQGIMEYVIITSLVGICCLGAMSTFGKKVKERITQMKERVSQDIIVKE